MYHCLVVLLHFAVVSALEVFSSGSSSSGNTKERHRAGYSPHLTLGDLTSDLYTTETGKCGKSELFIQSESFTHRHSTTCVQGTIR